MSILLHLTAGLRSLFRRRELDQDLDDEVRHFIEMATQENMRAGMARAQAERAARVAFGGVESAKEGVRAAGWESHVDSLIRDVRYALRGVRRNPGFTTVVVLTLALGIGANTAMFSVVNAVMLRPLPYGNAQDLVMMWTDDVKRGLHEEGTAYITITDWRKQAQTLSDIAFFSTMSTVLSGASNTQERERTRSAYVSANLFRVLGAQPLLGRTITDDEEASGARVAVISYELWVKRYGGDSAILGKMLDVETAPKFYPAAPQIIGVMPPAFNFPDKSTEFWTPATTYWRWARESYERNPAWARRWTAIGRMRAGRRADDVRRDMAVVASRLAATYPSTLPDFPGYAVNVVPIMDHVAGRTLQRTLWILLGAVGLVLLVACANIANLMLARGAVRQHEFAIRRALGAGRGRLVRQLLVESTTLAVLGGIVGLIVATSATKALAVSATLAIPRMEEIGIDGAVLAFGALASLVAGIAFGLVPALRLSQASPGESLREGTGHSTGGVRLRRTRGVLVVAECALAMVLLTGAGLLIRSLIHLQAVEPGFQPDGVLSMRVEFPRLPPPATTGRGPGSEMQFAAGREDALHQLAQRITGLPGAEAVAFDDNILIGRDDGDASIVIPGRASDSVTTGQLYVSAATPGFLELMRVPLVRGRYLTRADAAVKIRALWSGVNTGLPFAEKVARLIPEPVVVNETFTRRYFSNEDPIDKRFCIDPTNKTYCFVIVGVVRDMRRQGLDRQAIPEYFETALPFENAELLVRTRGDPLSAGPGISQLIRSAMPGSIVTRVTTVDRLLGALTAQRRFQTWLLAAFASLALALAAVGIYGVVQYAVSERTREIGVRIALGATPSNVLGLVIGQGMRTPAIGIALGVLASLVVTRLLAHLVFEVGTTDPTTFLSVAGILLAVALAACWIPAHRATRVDVSRALRQE